MFLRWVAGGYVDAGGGVFFAGRGINGGGSAWRVVSGAAGMVNLIILISRIDGAANYKNYKNYKIYTHYTIYGSLWVGGAAGESAGEGAILLEPYK